MNKPLVLTNADIVTMDSAHAEASAMAVENGRILRLGTANDMAGLLDQGADHLDLSGAAVLPGFIDTHQHLMLTGNTALGLDLESSGSVSKIIEKIDQEVTKTAKGSWLKGWKLDELTLKEQRFPSRKELDAVAPDHPVILYHITLHRMMLNTLAWEILKLPNSFAGADQGPDGPTGLVRDPGSATHIFPAIDALSTEAQKTQAMETACRLALSKGITTLHALDGGEMGAGDTALIVRNMAKMPARLVPWNQCMDLEEVLRLGLPRVGGCIFADGEIDARTAALFEPYADDPDNYGVLFYTQEEMDKFILEAHEYGLQTAVHCEAERGIEQVLWALEKALRKHPRPDHRHRIEHLELPTPRQVERMAEAEIIASVQPAFMPYFIAGEEKMAHCQNLFGPARFQFSHPYRTLADHGVVLCGGSDSPVTSYDPLLGIQAAADHVIPEQSLTVQESLALFTSNAAFAGFEEAEKGTLTPGKLADFIVLEKNPLKTPIKKISQIGIRSVYVGGVLQHGNP